MWALIKTYHTTVPVCLLLAVCLCVKSVHGQGVTEIWTDQPSYVEGETIEITFKVSNPDLITYTWTSRCNAPYVVFDDVELNFEACIAYLEHFQFSPGSWRSWTIPLRPQQLGLPRFSGHHRVIVKFAHLADSVYFDAPIYEGGIVEVGNAPSANVDSVEAIKSTLQAVVTWSGAPHGSFEYWEISGTTPEAASAQYQGPDVFIKPRRFLSDMTSVDTEPAADKPRATVVDAYPNPFRTSTTIKLQLPVSQDTTVEVYDLLGRRMSTLHDGFILAGQAYTFTWPGKNFPVGQYVYRVSGYHYQKTGLLVRL